MTCLCAQAFHISKQGHYLGSSIYLATNVHSMLHDASCCASKTLTDLCAAYMAYFPLKLTSIR